MVEEKLEPEAQILEHIKEGKNFLLSGGAGSGKTYSLVQVIKKVIEDNPTTKIACMTYTNAAVKEIEQRVGHDNLSVSTIHDFLWDNIKTYQKELKEGLVKLINDDTSKIRKRSEIEGEVDMSLFENIEDGIQYKEYMRLKEGFISHDEVLELANYMFKEHKLLCGILKDKFKFIFIDEYQDTDPLVIEIFVVHIKQSQKKNIVGFFGDAMQAIYDDGIGDLRAYIDSKDVVEVLKTQNRRNPQLVIDLANKLRTDRLQQEASTIDVNAPNMLNGTVKQGNIKFLYSEGKDLKVIKQSSYFEGWDFEDAKQTKELNLTHNLIAPQVGFPTLMEIYDKDPIIQLKNDIRQEIKKNPEAYQIADDATFDEVVELVGLERGRGKDKRLRKDLIIEDSIAKALYDKLSDLPFSEVRKIYLDKEALIDDKKQDEDDEKKKGSKRDRLIKHLHKIQTNIHLYQEKQYNEFLRKTEFRVNSIADKRELKKIISEISGKLDYTIEEAINIADEKGICKKDDAFNQFVEKNKYLFDRVKLVKYQEFQRLYRYLEGLTSYSTQHKIKGAEFDNVLVILDNGRWPSYNFKTLFRSGTINENVLERTQKIFYVCCTRAKESLIVYFDSPDSTVITKAKEWFGEDNVHRLSV